MAFYVSDINDANEVLLRLIADDEGEDPIFDQVKHVLNVASHALYDLDGDVIPNFDDETREAKQFNFSNDGGQLFMELPDGADDVGEISYRRFAIPKPSLDGDDD
jgi:hypothetical protein